MITLSPTGRSPDDANNINAALASAGSSRVLLTAGNYLIGSSDHVVWPVDAVGLSLVGEGPAATQLIFQTRSTDGMIITKNADCQLRDIGFVGQGAYGGALVREVNTHNFVAEDVVIRGQYNDGFAIDGGPQQFITTLINVDIDADSGTGYRAIVVGENALVQDLYMTTCKTAQTQYGIWLSNVSGFYELNSQCYAHRSHGLTLYPRTGQVCQWFQATGHLSDSCSGTGVYLGSGGGTVRGLQFANLWSSSNGIGVEVWEGVRMSGISRGLVLANKNEAVANYGSPDFVLTDVVIN